MVDDVLVVVGDAVSYDGGMVISTDTVVSVADGGGKGGDAGDSGVVVLVLIDELVGSRDRPVAVDGGGVGGKGVHGSYLDDKSQIKDAVRMAEIGLTSAWMLDDFKVAIAKYIISPPMSDTNLKVLHKMCGLSAKAFVVLSYYVSLKFSQFVIAKLATRRYFGHCISYADVASALLGAAVSWHLSVIDPLAARRDALQSTVIRLREGFRRKDQNSSASSSEGCGSSVKLSSSADAGHLGNATVPCTGDGSTWNNIEGINSDRSMDSRRPSLALRSSSCRSIVQKPEVGSSYVDRNLEHNSSLVVCSSSGLESQAKGRHTDHELANLLQDKGLDPNFAVMLKENGLDPMILALLRRSITTIRLLKRPNGECMMNSRRFSSMVRRGNILFSWILSSHKVQLFRNSQLAHEKDIISHISDFGSISVVKTSSPSADGSLVSVHGAKSSPTAMSPAANLPTIMASESLSYLVSGLGKTNFRDLSKSPHGHSKKVHPKKSGRDSSRDLSVPVLIRTIRRLTKEKEIVKELKSETLLTTVLREKLYSLEIDIKQLQADLAAIVRGNDILKYEVQNALDALSYATSKLKYLELQLTNDLQECMKELDIVKVTLPKVFQERDFMWEKVKSYSEMNMLLNYEINILQRKEVALEGTSIHDIVHQNSTCGAAENVGTATKPTGIMHEPVRADRPNAFSNNSSSVLSCIQTAVDIPSQTAGPSTFELPNHALVGLGCKGGVRGSASWTSICWFTCSTSCVFYPVWYFGHCISYAVVASVLLGAAVSRHLSITDPLAARRDALQSTVILLREGFRRKDQNSSASSSEGCGSSVKGSSSADAGHLGNATVPFTGDVSTWNNNEGINSDKSIDSERPRLDQCSSSCRSVVQKPEAGSSYVDRNLEHNNSLVFCPSSGLETQGGDSSTSTFANQQILDLNLALAF
ncbi:hypothetical protein T459_28828 [Capsicum annuum]|uniref:Calpain-type cysteine protease DEK1 n=1 Tax=Capsicum annuum TaxID=4072 RepID=A0A2G2YIC6_CAPAN|nr:hypothetical protein T459_28828 [Capsicum annuum]